MMFEDFVHFMRGALAGDLPGKAAHLKMVSPKMTDRIFVPKPDARQSAVLVTLYPSNGHVNTIYIKRQDYDGVHSGQISFPGGKAEPVDKDLSETALRESFEEIGLLSDNIELIGSLSSLYIERSNHLVQPYVGVVRDLNPLVPHQREVKKIIHTSIPKLLFDTPIQHFNLERNEFTFEMPYYDMDGEILWGATAMMTSELLEISTPFFKR